MEFEREVKVGYWEMNGSPTGWMVGVGEARIMGWALEMEWKGKAIKHARLSVCGSINHLMMDVPLPPWERMMVPIWVLIFLPAAVRQATSGTFPPPAVPIPSSGFFRCVLCTYLLLVSYISITTMRKGNLVWVFSSMLQSYLLFVIFYNRNVRDAKFNIWLCIGILDPFIVNLYTHTV